MQHLSLAIRLSSLRLPLKQALHTAARLRVAGVEIDPRSALPPAEFTQTALRDLRKLLDDLNLRVAALSFFPRRGFHVEEELDRRLDAARRILQIAYKLGARWVITSLGKLPARQDEKPWNLLVEVLTDLGRYGEHVGAMLAAETGPDDESAMAELLQALPQGALWIALNPGALLVHGHHPKNFLERLADHVVYVYATDGVRDPRGGLGAAVPLGRGVADFPALLGVLEEHHYHGYLTLVPAHSNDPVAELAAAAEYLKNAAA